MTLADRTRKFWSAAFFLRRAPDRNRSIPIKVLEQVARTTTGRVHDRAITLLKDINDDEPTCS